MNNRFFLSALLSATVVVAACSDATPTGTSSTDVALAAKGGNGGGGNGGGGNGGGGNGGGGGGNGGGGGAASAISFLAAAPGAPALVSGSVSFYAVQGQDRSGELLYASGDRLVRLRIRKKAQIVRPNGQALAKGDSILITITVADAAKLIVDFQPSGILFNGSEAATLNMWYLHTHPDINNDGVVNAADAALENTLAIFRQETPGAPWIRMTSLLSTNVDEIETNIGGFTNYVIAY